MHLPLFRFTQIEVPFPLGPPDGRYLLRGEGAAPGSDPTHVLVISTLAAARLPGRRRRRGREVPPDPPPQSVATTRATVVAVGEPVAERDIAELEHWLRAAGEPELQAGLGVLARALQTYRVVSADPAIGAIEPTHLLVARLGFGTGEDVADGRWNQARELPLDPRATPSRARLGGRRRRLEPQARFADALRGSLALMLCDELTLRARQDLDHGRTRAACAQLLIALDAALAELPAAAAELDVTPDHVTALGPRLAELSAQRDAITRIAEHALAQTPADAEVALVRHCLERLEAALRARLAAADHSAR